jgi:hypothetical protein
MADWREQYRRMKRARDSMNTTWNDRASRPDHMDHVLDAFYGFFQSCYHMVDWLENDPSQPIRRSDADRFVYASPALALCSDLCHGSKHATLEARRLLLRPEREVLSSLPIQDATGKMIAAISVSAMEMSVIRAGQIAKNAFDLADECISEWDRFLSENGLSLDALTD